MLSEAYEYFGCNTADVFVISVNLGESNAACIQFDETYGIEFPCLSGNEGGGTAVNNTYGISAYPTYILIAPDHTIVEQDMWPIASVQTFKNYFQSHGIQASPCGSTLTASFTADDYTVCQSSQVQFSDASTGNPTSWSWTFEGGTPATSNLQNPLVTYDVAGSWNVTLDVSNGTSNNTITSPDIILVDPPPVAFAGPDGETCINEAFTLVDASAQNAFMISWVVTSGFGTLDNSSSLNPTYTPAAGDVGITVLLTMNAYGTGGCSTEISSSTLSLSVHGLPDVTLQAFDTVCYEWQSFELTGGFPAGGYYSGTGVAYGWFDPATAGIGTHTITYAYSDANDCEKSVEGIMEVTSCVGLTEPEHSFYSIYPNPTAGNISVDLKKEGEYSLQIINPNGSIVFDKKIQKSMVISLNGLEDGLYMLKINNGIESYIQKLTVLKD
jgi:PKD repeat protein